MNEKGKIKLDRLVEPELNYFREQCNFSDEELSYFNLKAKNKSIIEIAFAMNISQSKVSVLAKRVKNKILKVI